MKNHYQILPGLRTKTVSNIALTDKKAVSNITVTEKRKPVSNISIIEKKHSNNYCDQS